MDAAEADALFAAADAAGRVLVEAYMTPFHPSTEAMVAARRRRPASATCAPCGRRSPSRSSPSAPADHRFDPVLGGGASLDVGIYCTAPVLGPPGGSRSPSPPPPPGQRPAPTARWRRSSTSAPASAAPSTSRSSCRLRQRLELVGTEAALVVRPGLQPRGSAPAASTSCSSTGTTTTHEFAGASAYLGMVEHVQRRGARRRGPPPRPRRDARRGPHNRPGEGGRRRS